MEYRILTVKSVHIDRYAQDRLCKRVVEAAEDGWVPLGGPVYGRDHFLKEDVISQAMVRYDPPSSS